MLIEVDVGQNRCGVASVEEVLALAAAVHAHTSLRFEGIQCYQGAAQHIRTTEGRAAVGKILTTGPYYSVLFRQCFVSLTHNAVRGVAQKATR